jgi:transposase
MAESFFGALKNELVHRTTFPTRAHAHRAIVRYIEMFYNGCLEHLRGSALGFRNLTNYAARSLLETGGFRPRLHPQS